MWFDPCHRNERWSICSQMNELDVKLGHVRFPSTTTRRPRSIIKFNKYKGNELRSLLLFGFSIFEGILQRPYYSHLLLLVLVMHLSESRSLDQHCVEDLHHLCTSFVSTFPRIYSARHNVQVIHSLVHIPESVKAFGPVSNYSTFNFESLLGVSEHFVRHLFDQNEKFFFTILGLITRTCNSTRKHAIEIINTIVQLRETCRLIDTPHVRPKLQHLLSTWVLRRSLTMDNQIRLLHQIKSRSVTFISRMWTNKKIDYYSTLYIGHVRITTAAFADQKATDDSSILIKINGIDQFAVVKEIFCVDGEDSFVQACCLSAAKSFECSTSSAKFSFNNIQHGSMGNDFIVSTKNIVEKCVRIEYPSASVLTFIRFPSLSICS